MWHGLPARVPAFATMPPHVIATGGSLKAAGFWDGRPEIDKQKMNRLICGDNLLAMQALLNQGYEGKINLIYIDPPFDSKADYSNRMTISP